MRLYLIILVHLLCFQTQAQSRIKMNFKLGGDAYNSTSVIGIGIGLENKIGISSSLTYGLLYQNITTTFTGSNPASSPINYTLSYSQEDNAFGGFLNYRKYFTKGFSVNTGIDLFTYTSSNREYQETPFKVADSKKSFMNFFITAGFDKRILQILEIGTAINYYPYSPNAKYNKSTSADFSYDQQFEVDKICFMIVLSSNIYRFQKKSL